MAAALSSCLVGSFEQPLCVQPWVAVQGSGAQCGLLCGGKNKGEVGIASRHCQWAWPVGIATGHSLCTGLFDRYIPKNIVVFALSLQEIINISDRIRACCESACDVSLEQFTAAKYVISGWAYVEKQTEYGLHPFLCLLWKDNAKNAAEGLLCSGLELFCQR